jgi:methyl-accepting chemotaxis protein
MNFLNNLLALFNWREPFSKLERKVNQMALNLEKLTAAFARLDTEVGETINEVAKLKEMIGDNAEAQAVIDGITEKLESVSDALDGLQEKPQA